jgi:hypothetical protein
MLFLAIPGKGHAMPWQLAVGPLRQHVPAALGIAALLSLAPGGARATAAAADQPVEVRMLAAAAGAPIALSGDLAAVRTRSGIEVLGRRGEAWLRQAVITPPTDMTGGFFGASLALSGGTLAVGTDQAVYVFTRTGQRWGRETRIDAPLQLSNPGGSFGYALALANDVLIVGTPNYFYPHASGAAFAYSRDASGRWALEAVFGNVNDLPDYGFAVAVSGAFAFVSGETLGFVDVYERLPRRWRHVGQLTGGENSFSGLGFGAALSASGSTLVVGGDEQEVFVFFHAHGQWIEQARLPAPHPFSYFGVAAAIDEDTLVVGDEILGDAYVYTRGLHAWDLAAILKPAGPTKSFGSAVAVSGHTALVAGFDAGPAQASAVWVVDGLDEP